MSDGRNYRCDSRMVMTLCSSLPSLCRLTCVGILKNAVIAGLLYAPVTEFLSIYTIHPPLIFLFVLYSCFLTQAFPAIISQFLCFCCFACIFSCDLCCLNALHLALSGMTTACFWLTIRFQILHSLHVSCTWAHSCSVFVTLHKQKEQHMLMNANAYIYIHISLFTHLSMQIIR